MGKHKASGRNPYEEDVKDLEEYGEAMLKKKYVPVVHPSLPKVKKV